MVTFKYISLALFVIITNAANSQWLVCTGTVIGIGAFPTISIPDCSTVVLAGGSPGNPKVFRSTNSGASFVDITGNIAGPELFTVWAKSRDTIFTADGGSNGGGGGNAKVWKTVNGGVSWTNILTTGGTAGFINGIRFVRPEQRLGVIMSDAPTGTSPIFFKTYDGGETWNLQTVTSNGGSLGSVGTVFITDSLFYGFGHGNASRITMTTNGGLNWSFINVSLTSNSTFSIDCGPNRNCLAASYSSLPNIVRFNPSGINEVINIGPGLTGFPYFCWVYGTETVYLGGTTGALGCVKKSSNTGTNWSQMTTASITGIIGIDLFYSGTTVCAYAFAQDGTLLKLNEEVIGINNISGTVPNTYLLEQNYPNPFNPTTKIKFNIPLLRGVSEGRGVFVQLIIYDILGREVTTLVNEQLKPGTYEASWDASNYTSGVYYYKLSAGDFAETKKMVLVK